MRIEEIKANIKFNIWEDNKDEFLKYLEELTKLILTQGNKDLFVNEIISLLWNTQKQQDFIDYVLGNIKSFLDLDYDIISFYKKYNVVKTQIENKGEFLAFESILDLIDFPAPYQLKYEWYNLFVNLVWSDRDRVIKYKDTLNRVISEMKNGEIYG